MDKIELICELVKAVAALIPTLVAVFLMVKNIVKTKNWQQICEITKAAMTTAEEYAALHPSMTSDEKLDFALAIIKDGLAAGRVKVDDLLIKQIVAYINELCRFTKQINIECIVNDVPNKEN